MLVMFGVFAVLFYIDGSTGYRKKNEIYYLNKAFQKANEEFSKMNTGGTLSSADWKNYAAKQSVVFPEDRTVLPTSITLPMPWPPVLHDFERMKSLQWNILWREYTKERGLDATPPEHPYNAGKIKEQWVVFGVCSSFALVAAFFLVRTMNRRISVDGEAVTSQQGTRVPFSDLTTLDLRKWDTKGIAFIDYKGVSGKGRIRLDGLTYGGFKKEHDEPAERLMRQIRSRFAGEIIEYAAVAVEPSKDKPTPPA